MIRLTKQTDYALVLLTQMATTPVCDMHTARDLAERTHLPLPMVSKILKTLGRHGLLISHRGSKGGYSLATDPENITVAEIIRVLEGPIALTECSVHSSTSCVIESSCPTSLNFRRISRAVTEALEGISLEEMAKPWRDWLGPIPRPEMAAKSQAVLPAAKTS